MTARPGPGIFLWCVALLFWQGQGSLPAQTRVDAIGAVADVDLDWATGDMVVSVTAPIAPGGSRRPDAAFEARRLIDDAAPDLILLALLDIHVDHERRVRDVLESRPGFRAAISRVIAGRRTLAVYPTLDLQGVTVEYGLPLHPDFISLFVNHQTPLPLPSQMTWAPSRDFTGLVIIARGPLPVRGTDESAPLVRALFPRIFDANLTPLFVRGTMEPSSILERGSVAYVESLDDPELIARAGDRHFIVMARELFGITPTDLVIGSTSTPELDDAAIFLASPSAERILREGRIVVVTDP